MADRSFQLTKWYFDMLDPSCRGLIGYHAEVSWGKINMHYEGVIPVGAAGFKSKGKFKTDSNVRQVNGQVDWQGSVCTGTWRARSPAVHHKLLAIPEGSVTWHCLQPAADVEVKVGNVSLQGRGYAEKLEMTLPPWRLPIEELLWGRYVSDKHALVWIRWSGPEPRVVLYFNGRLIPEATITSSEIAFEDVRLLLPSTLVRKGTLGESLFSGADKLAGLFPKSILALYEEKWCGLAELEKGNSHVDSGNVIHERVQWP